MSGCVSQSVSMSQSESEYWCERVREKNAGKGGGGNFQQMPMINVTCDTRLKGAR